MSKTGNHSDSATRRQILQAALKSFARRGYAAASVQDIVDAARVSKPALYYYFADKAHLFQALVDEAHDERYRLMQQAAARGATVAEKLEEMVAAIFEFSLRNRALMRLAFATAFAASGEVPGGLRCREKGRRNFEFIRSLIAQGQKAGELARRFDLDQLAMGIFGMLNSYVMVRLLVPDCPLNRQTARLIIQLFFEGAANRPAPVNGATGVTGGALLPPRTPRRGAGREPARRPRSR
jgi:TetR/AcrR family transcriptional regulator